jgi:hypothetical protein
VTFKVEVVLRKSMANGALVNQPLPKNSFQLKGLNAPGKMQSRARVLFNESKYYHGKHLLRAVSTSYNAATEVITVVAETEADIAAREEAARVRAGGVPSRHVPRSRHHAK